MATVTIRVESDVVVHCTKKAAKLYDDEGNTSKLDQHAERLEAAVENAIVKMKGYESHDGVAVSIVEVSLDE